MKLTGFAAWHAHFHYFRGPMGASIACKYCKHFETMKGSKLAHGIVTEAKGRMIDHIKTNHQEEAQC